MHAQETEKVIEIEDGRKWSEEEMDLFNSKQHQNYDVKVVRRFVPPEGGYMIYFFLVKDGTLKKHFWGVSTKVNYDKLSYYWRGDTCFHRFENSTTKERMDQRFNPTESGSILGITDSY
jgi:hypothetical protein